MPRHALPDPGLKNGRRSTIKHVSLSSNVRIVCSSFTLIPLALLAPLAAAIPDDANPLLDILTADDSTPESAYSVNPAVAETAVGAPVGVSGPVATSSPSADDSDSETETEISNASTGSGSVSTSSAEPETTADAPSTTTTSIPTNILTAIESDPTGSAAGSMTTVVATTTTHQSGSGAAETSSTATATPSDGSEGSAASPTPTDDGAAAVLGSPASMLGAVLLSFAVRFF